MQIIIEEETPGDSATLFRLQIGDRIVGQNLTAAQAHLLVGEILGRLALPHGATPLPLNQHRPRERIAQ
jgi:hypothetical protein